MRAIAARIVWWLLDRDLRRPLGPVGTLIWLLAWRVAGEGDEAWPDWQPHEGQPTP